MHALLLFEGLIKNTYNFIQNLLGILCLSFVNQQDFSNLSHNQANVALTYNSPRLYDTKETTTTPIHSHHDELFGCLA